MPNFDESVINFAVYEDSVEYVGMAGVTLPNLAAIVQTLSGAGIAGNVEVPVLGHYDVMSLTLNFRTTTEHSIKHVLVVVPKTDTGGTVAPAAPTNGSGEYSVRYWATYIDGAKVREIDPLNFICEVNGVDYLADVRKAIGK